MEYINTKTIPITPASALTRFQKLVTFSKVGQDVKDAQNKNITKCDQQNGWNNQNIMPILVDLIWIIRANVPMGPPSRVHGIRFFNL